MAENEINKDVCAEKHKTVDEKLVDLKANIRTSKESLSNHLDEVDAAIRGDRNSPGGLLRDVQDMQEEFDTHEGEVRRELDRIEKDVKIEIAHHKENTTKDIVFLRWVIGVSMGLSVLAFGGRFLGFNVENLKENFKKTPVVQTAPPVEEDKTIPDELKEILEELLKNHTEHNLEYEDGHIDIPAENIDMIPSEFLDSDVHPNGHKDISITDLNKLLYLENK